MCRFSPSLCSPYNIIVSFQTEITRYSYSFRYVTTTSSHIKFLYQLIQFVYHFHKKTGLGYNKGVGYGFPPIVTPRTIYTRAISFYTIAGGLPSPPNSPMRGSLFPSLPYWKQLATQLELKVKNEEEVYSLLSQ